MPPKKNNTTPNPSPASVMAVDASEFKAAATPEVKSVPELNNQSVLRFQKYRRLIKEYGSSLNLYNRSINRFNRLHGEDVPAVAERPKQLFPNWNNCPVEYQNLLLNHINKMIIDINAEHARVKRINRHNSLATELNGLIDELNTLIADDELPEESVALVELTATVQQVNANILAIKQRRVAVIDRLVEYDVEASSDFDVDVAVPPAQPPREDIKHQPVVAQFGAANGVAAAIAQFGFMAAAVAPEEYVDPLAALVGGNPAEMGAMWNLSPADLGFSDLNAVEDMHVDSANSATIPRP